MKKINLHFLIIMSLVFINCKKNQQPIEKKQEIPIIPEKKLIISSKEKEKEVEIMQLHLDYKEYETFSLNDTIFSDFNGDGNKDYAIFTSINKKNGIIIHHGALEEEIKIGFDKSFAHLDDLNWIEFWCLVFDKETNSVIFDKNDEIKGEKKVTLENTSIYVGTEDFGGGLITYKNKEYVWVHQAH